MTEMLGNLSTTMGGVITQHPDNVLSLVQRRRNDRHREYKRYVAIDIRNSLFDPRRLEELVTLYQDVFNGVEAVKSKWTQATASSLLQDRLSRPGSHIALLDTENGNKIVGAFFARIAPGREGMELTEPDVLIHKDYRGMKLGGELGFWGRINGGEVCKRLFSEGVTNNVSQTYKLPPFPRKMWEGHGYKTEDLFIQYAKDLLARPDAPQPPKNVAVRVVEENELESLAKFISSSNTASSDGLPWTLKRAHVFLNYMYTYNRAVMRVAENGTGIVGLMVGDTIPRRTGASLVNINGFLSKVREDGPQTATALLHEVLKAANTVSIANSRLPITEIEIPGPSVEFFKPLLPNLELDGTYVGMRGKHNQITSSLRPKGVRNASFVMGNVA